MKDENGNIIRTEQGNIKRWEEYFSKLLNEENERLIRGDGDANQGAVLQISRIEVQQAPKKMKNGKATGPDGIPIEAWKAMGEEGIDMLWMLMRKVMDEENIPTDGIFCLRQTMEKYREKQKVLHMLFIDLEKAYDRVPGQEVWRCMRKRGLTEKYLRMIQETYKTVTTKVRCTVGMTDGFEVKVGLHQGSALSPILFNVVMDVMTEEVREEPPWCILYADYIVLVAETKQELQRKMEGWRTAMESRGQKISRKKTEYFTTDTERKQQSTIKIDGLNLKRVDHFKYLGAMVEEDGNMGREIKHRIRRGWNNWRKVSGVICDKRVPVKLKGWMVGVTKMDCIRNNYIRGSLKIIEISKNVQESRLPWYGLRRNEDHVGRQTMEMEIEGNRPRGRPETRWKDVVQKDMREKHLDEAEALDRALEMATPGEKVLKAAHRSGNSCNAVGAKLHWSIPLLWIHQLRGERQPAAWAAS
ncbi:uncharacterized protein LOC119568275 [Penaeus monodon]|uniref:uncharacterized protein LOC119568275 n=1 Tax=Penaeus monodon TaxID=6687 RepID=UPI0018A79FCE|nr:uncharacterized protein LOC119568275 [Penaeus monodon]